MYEFDLINPAKTFHFTTGFSTIILQNGEIMRSFPENPSTAHFIISGKTDIHVNYSSNEYDMVQYLSNEYGECYVIYVVNSTFVIAAGPFLTKPMNSSDIVKLIQNSRISIKLKPKLEAHFQSIKLINAQTYFYCGKMISSLFSTKNISSALGRNEIGKEISFINDYFQNTYKNREKSFTHPPFFLEKKIVKQIMVCDVKGAIDTLQEINLLTRAVLAKDPIRSIKNSIICSCSFFTRAVIEAGVFPDIAFTYSDTFIQQIESMNTVSEVTNFELEMLRQFISLVEQKNATKYSRPVFNAMQYINNNLTQELHLDDIAKHSYVHPNYLSKIFKKEMGVSITDYISQRRVDESTYFVAYTDYEISDIASFYHFCNQSYYSTIFKRFLSVTPNEYRNNSRKSVPTPD